MSDIRPVIDPAAPGVIRFFWGLHDSLNQRSSSQPRTVLAITVRFSTKTRITWVKSVNKLNKNLKCLGCSIVIVWKTYLQDIPWPLLYIFIMASAVFKNVQYYRPQLCSHLRSRPHPKGRYEAALLGSGSSFKQEERRAGHLGSWNKQPSDQLVLQLPAWRL